MNHSVPSQQLCFQGEKMSFLLMYYLGSSHHFLPVFHKQDTPRHCVYAFLEGLMKHLLSHAVQGFILQACVEWLLWTRLLCSLLRIQWQSGAHEKLKMTPCEWCWYSKWFMNLWECDEGTPGVWLEEQEKCCRKGVEICQKLRLLRTCYDRLHVSPELAMCLWSP